MTNEELNYMLYTKIGIKAQVIVCLNCDSFYPRLIIRASNKWYYNRMYNIYCYTFKVACEDIELYIYENDERVYPNLSHIYECFSFISFPYDIAFKYKKRRHEFTYSLGIGENKLSMLIRCDDDRIL